MAQHGHRLGVVLSAIAIGGTLHGYGPFATRGAAESLLEQFGPGVRAPHPLATGVPTGPPRTALPPGAGGSAS